MLLITNLHHFTIIYDRRLDEHKICYISTVNIKINTEITVLPLIFVSGIIEHVKNCDSSCFQL